MGAALKKVADNVLASFPFYSHSPLQSSLSISVAVEDDQNRE